MPTVLIVESNGTIKELAMKQYVVADLYKRAGFKSPEGFQCHCTWSTGQPAVRIHLYGKSKGKANQENKYEFPPPVDTTLFFGSCLLVATTADNETVVDVSKAQWAKAYAHLYGGFEALGRSGGDDDAADAAEEAEALRRDRAESIELGLKMTKQGYVKDGFIVDDSDSSANAFDAGDDTTDDGDDEAYFGPSPKVAKGGASSVSSPSPSPLPSQSLPLPLKATRTRGAATKGRAKAGDQVPVPVPVVPVYPALVEEDYV